MIWLPLVAAAAAAASTHSVTGAFGYLLGELPASKVAGCERNEYEDRTEMFICTGDDFFNRVYIHTRRKMTTRVSGTRLYSGEPSRSASDACSADLTALKAALDRKYPRLLPARPRDGVTFEVAESLLGPLAYGRSISGRCKESSVDAPGGGKFVSLWLDYDISADEQSELSKLNDADRLSAQGLNPDKL